MSRKRFRKAGGRSLSENEVTAQSSKEGRGAQNLYPPADSKSSNESSCSVLQVVVYNRTEDTSLASSVLAQTSSLSSEPAALYMFQ
jgi:hypothetical protein